MRNRGTIIDSIISHLSVLKTEVGLKSKANLQDINVHAEQFYKILLNEIFSYELENINIIDQNATAIDLGDKTSKIAIQVTSDNSKTKIKDTVKSFNNKELYKSYDSLKILVIKDKTKRTDIIQNDNFTFNMKTDVIDVGDIIKAITDIDDIEQLEKIDKWLSTELVQKYYAVKNTPKSNEVKTFMSLIDYLSDDKNHKVFEIEDDPDPEYKIEKRFKEYAPYLKNLYCELYVDYAYALSLAEASEDITSVKVRKIGTYLKDISSNKLRSHDNNPEEALENLCEYFKSFFVNDNLDHDEMAIKFYLIHQLIKCNVFPN